jgi:hypothetical protein
LQNRIIVTMVAIRTTLLLLPLLLSTAVASATNIARWKSNHKYTESAGTFSPSLTPISATPTLQLTNAVDEDLTSSTQQQTSFHGWSLLLPLLTLSIIGYLAGYRPCTCGGRAVLCDDTTVQEDDPKTPPMAEIEIKSVTTFTSDLGEGSAVASSYVEMVDAC